MRDHGNSRDGQNDCASYRNGAGNIFLISILGLFLEMMLIRWIGTEIRIFAYLQNTILVVCFLGLGLGCLTSQAPVSLSRTLVPLSLLVLLLAVPFTRQALGAISEMLSSLGDVTIWAGSYSSSRWRTIINACLGLGLTYLIMVLVTDMFIPIGRLLGRFMDAHPNTIRAYSVNVAGSLAGTWLFVILSYLYQPPAIWILVFAALAGVLLVRSHQASWRNFVLLFGMVIFSWFAGQVPGSREVAWSPYQKLVVSDMDLGKGFMEYTITVNNANYQAMLSAKDPLPRRDGRQYDLSMRGVTQYDIPFLLKPETKSALILGAGAGNDVAGALRHGVKSITAIEIDPAIISFGRRYHPDTPYDSPAVLLVNDDARSFLASSRDRFDVISFGLLDSHTTNAMTNAPLDHYVYTRESIGLAKSLLADGGIMTLCFEAQKPYIADRMAGVLRELFGREPICFRIPENYYGVGGVMFIAGDLENARAEIAKNRRLSGLIEKLQREYPVSLRYMTRITSDDWPYIFLKIPEIPLLYYLLASLLAILVIRSRKYLNNGGPVAWPSRSHWHFFFLGAAFLLLEVQNISKASVVLGNTWEVNAVIVTGVLIMILAANLLTLRFPGISLKAVYLTLCTICLVLYFVDLSSFAYLPYPTKAAVVGGISTLPMFFSGIVFIRSFTSVAEKDKALGANLIGALVGAMLQSVTFITGIRALLLVVMALYLLAMLTDPRGKRRLVADRDQQHAEASC